MLVTKENELVWKYLPYVTVRDIVREAKGYIWAWLVVSIITLVIGGLIEYGKDQLGFSFGGSSEFSFLPRWLWVAVIAGVILWFGRGKEVRFVIPVFGFKSWLFYMFLFGGFFYTIAHFEWWVSLPFAWGVLITENALDDLGMKGKENFEKLHNAEEP
jgi:hypothetical protein